MKQTFQEWKQANGFSDEQDQCRLYDLYLEQQKVDLSERSINLQEKQIEFNLQMARIQNGFEEHPETKKQREKDESERRILQMKH